MREQVHHIAVAGNIGAGKTTLVRKLADHYRWDPLFEAVDHNPYLEDFYQDMKAWAFPTQIFFLHSRFQQMLDILSTQRTIIQDRTIHEDAHIFTRNLYESGYLSERDYGNYLALFRTMTSTVRPPDLLIYLRASVPRLIEQIARRGRSYETSLSIRYLEDLNRLYEEWIGSYREGPLLIIDANQLDYLRVPEHFGEVIRRIDGELFGLF